MYYYTCVLLYVIWNSSFYLQFDKDASIKIMQSIMGGHWWCSAGLKTRTLDPAWVMSLSPTSDRAVFFPFPGVYSALAQKMRRYFHCILWRECNIKAISPGVHFSCWPITFPELFKFPYWFTHIMFNNIIMPTYNFLLLYFFFADID